MINGKKKKLVSLLAEKINSNKIKWQVADTENELRATIGDNTIGLREGTNPFSSGMASHYVLVLFDADGRVADSFSDVDLDVDEHPKKWYAALHDLYIEARRGARGSDRVINSLLDELGG